MLMKSETDYSYLGEPSLAMKLRQWGMVALLACYGVLLIVLFVLYSSDSDDDSTSQSSGAVGTFSSAAVLSAAQVGLAASLQSINGALQLGGGTSVYQDRYSVSAVCAKTPAVEPVFESSYVMTFIDGVQDSTTVTLLEATSARDLEASFSVVYDKQLAGLSALDWGADQGLLVGIAQDVSADQDEAVVVALLATNAPAAVSFGAETVYGGQYSVNPQVTRLSSSSFAITYLDNVTTTLPDGSEGWQYSALTRCGVVDAGDNSITLSAPVIFASDDNYELQSRVIGLTDTSYLLVTNTAEQVSDQGFHYGHLQARVATVSDGAVTLGAVSTFSTTEAAFNMGSARVDNSTALLTYCDYSNNFGISVVALKVATDNSVSVSAAMPLTSGQTLAGAGEAGDLQMDLDLAVFGGNQFVVTFSDITSSSSLGPSGGALTAVTGRLSASGELSRTSPDLLLGPEDESGGDNGAVYQWHAMAARGGGSSSDGEEVAIVSSLQGLSCDLTASGLSVSMMHVLPAPLGVLASASRQEGGVPRADAQLSGWMGGYQNLQPGMLYYTNTFGELTAAGVYYGHLGTTGGGSTEAAAGDFYVHDAESGSLMTGLLGVAVSETVLLIKA